MTANKFSSDLMDLQDGLRQAMLVWHYHHTGERPIQDAKAFEDLLVAANFALAEIRLDIMGFESATAELMAEAQKQLQESSALLRQALALFDRLAEQAEPPAMTGNVLLFTGAFRPQAANDAPPDGAA